MIVGNDPSKSLRLLLAFFGEARLPHCTEVAAQKIPDPYRYLLVHEAHMTVTLENHHGGPVSVHPYQIHGQGNLYGRKLDLRLVESGKVVMTGAMLFNFSFCSPQVRDLIVEGKTPLGRILIEHNILRRVSVDSFLKLDASDPLVSRFEMDVPQDAYGRIATIFCDEQPAVDLLEIVRPAEPS